MTEVTFELAPGKPLLLLPAFVNGDGPYPFVLDTGAARTVIAPALAQQLGIESETSEDAFGAGGTQSARAGRVGFLSVGSAHHVGLDVTVTEIDAVARVIGRPIAGLLGYNFLKRFALEIDYRTRRLVLDESSSLQRGEPMALAPLKPIPIVPTRVNDRGPYDFVVDTGTSMTSVSVEVATAVGLAIGSKLEGLGAGGPVVVRLGHLDSLAVGPWRGERLDVAVADFYPSLERAAGMKLDGIIGYNFFRAFRLTLDYPARRFRLA